MRRMPPSTMLDAAIVEKTRESIPMMQGVADGISDRRLARDPSKLVLEPRPERDHEWPTSLTRRTPPFDAVATDRLLDQSRLRDFGQGDKWSFCLTAGTLWPANQERP